MFFISEATRSVLGPITKDQIAEANGGSYQSRLWKKAKVGLRAELLSIPISAAAFITAAFWYYTDWNIWGDGMDRLSSMRFRCLTPNGLQSTAGSGLASELIRSAVIPPLWEEACFRGLIQPLLTGCTHRLIGGEDEKRNLAEWAGIIGSALLFGGGHGAGPQAVMCFSSGVLYGYLRQQLENKEECSWLGLPFRFIETITPTVVGHATHNGLVVGIGHLITLAERAL